MHHSLGPATLACLLTTVALVVVAPLSAQNKLYTFYGDSAEDRFGHSVAGAGDVNQDGYDDLIVGAYYDDDNGSLSGSARGHHGGPSVSSLGSPCRTAPCDTCPELRAVTSGGLPYLGNTSFALDLLGAPTNATYAVIVASEGACSWSGLPGVCDLVLVPEPWTAFGFALTPPTTSLSLPTPIPTDLALLGLSVSFQWGVGCSGGGFPLSTQTNCVTLTTVVQ